MDRPQHEKWMGSSSRALTRLWRTQSAWDMAHLLGDVTEEAYEKAYDLLNRCTRWALAQMRFDESETAENCNSRYRKHQGELLDRRYERLSAELEPYGCRIMNLGYFSQDVYQVDERNLPMGYGFLHFFD